MDICKGMVVLSKAGRDRQRFFAVLRVDGRYVLLSDGKYHTLEKPKRKNLLHVAVTGTVLAEQSMVTNSEIQKALKRFQG